MCWVPHAAVMAATAIAAVPSARIFANRLIGQGS